MRYCVYLSSVSEVTGISPHCLRIIRKASGGQFALIRVAATEGRPATSMVELSEVLEWASRVIRPWTPEMAARLRGLARPEGSR